MSLLNHFPGPSGILFQEQVTFQRAMRIRESMAGEVHQLGVLKLVQYFVTVRQHYLLLALAVIFYLLN